MASAKEITELREKTGAGMMDCKAALDDSKGDLEKAIEFLRKKGLASAQKKAARTAAKGLVFAYIHSEGTVGAMVEINCETDFVARTDDFKELCKDVAMQICAMNPLYVKREDIPPEVIEKEKSIFREEVIKSGKPEKIADKIVEGKIEKYCKDVCLVDQAFIKDDKQTIKDIVTAKIAKTGENMVIKRFSRFKVGEK